MNETTVSAGHALDVRAKLLVALFGGLAVLALDTFPALLLLGLGAVGYAAAHARLRHVVAMNLAIVVFATAFLLATRALQGTIAGLEGAGGHGSAIPFLRSLVLANAMLVVGTTTKVRDLSGSLSSLPLPAVVRFTTLVVLRCLPSLVKDLASIRDATLLRQRGSGLFALPLALVRSPRSVTMPLLVGALRTSDDLAVAAELKGLGVAARRRTAPWRPSFRDAVTVSAAVVALLTSCALHVGLRVGLLPPGPGVP